VKDLNSVKDHIEVLRYVKSQRAMLKELEEVSRAAVEEALGEEEFGALDGETVVTWKFSKDTRLNQSALKEDHPELVDEYKQTSVRRTFSVQ
jgi:predicted phage-related endonuclease